MSIPHRVTRLHPPTQTDQNKIKLIAVCESVNGSACLFPPSPPADCSCRCLSSLFAHSYLKIGACRHGERCSRKHIKPQYSQTIVITNMYQNPAHQAGTTSNPHLRPQGSAPLDPNPKSDLSEDELVKYFDQFCKSAPSHRVLQWDPSFRH